MILSFPVPEPNSLLWVSNAGISSCVVLFPVVVSRVSFLNLHIHHRDRVRDKVRRFICFSAFRNVSFGLTPRKNPILVFLGNVFFHV